MKYLVLTLFLIGAVHAEPIKINLVTTNDIHGMIAPQKANFMNPQYPPTILGGAAFSKYVDKLPKLPYMQELVISVIIFSVVAAAIGSFVYGRSEEPEVKETTPSS